MRIIENYTHAYGAKKKKASKKPVIFAFATAMLSLTIAISTFTHSTSDPDLALQSQDNENNASTLGMLDERAYVSYDFSLLQMPPEGQMAYKVVGGEAWTNGSNDIAPMASITKVVTALAVLDKATLQLGEQGQTITFTQQDEYYYNDYLSKLGTVTGVTSGETISQYQALQAILLASSNNIADTLADNFFGSQEEFVSYTNQMLTRLGITDTYVADASGFNPSSASSPLDILKIGEIALANPVIAEIVAQDEAFIMKNVRIPNYNSLIGLDEINGIKPGFTDEAGHCLLFSAKLPNSRGDQEQFIAVVMGVHDRNQYREYIRALFDGAKGIIASQEPIIL